MSCVNALPSSALDYDFLVVGGGTAGCVVASRLAEALPNCKILMIEGGPSDYGNELILDLKRQIDTWGGEYDYQYTSVEQPFGNSKILHSRARVLGGCSSHNGGISFRPLEYDARKWQEAGAHGWTFDQFVRLVNKLRTSIHPVYPQFQNPVDVAFIESSAKAFNIPKSQCFNDDIVAHGNVSSTTGFISAAYNPANGFRSSASAAYLHPIFEGKEHRPNLTILTNTRVYRINVDRDTVTGVQVMLQSGQRLTLTARAETILCAGAIDTPRLLLLSGIGPRQQLSSLNIPLVRDLRGVGENLMDHPESLILWELQAPLPPQTVTRSDPATFLRREPPGANGDDGDVADVLCHVFGLCFDANTARLGYDSPKNAYSFMPNVPRPRSRGRLYLVSADPDVRPAIDPAYFTDPEGYDRETILFGLKAGRKLAETAPLRDLIKREVAPGPEVQTDEQLVEYSRKAHNTVYHLCGTTKIGDTERDEMAVVDPALKVRGLRKLRIADAGVFPVIPSVNPMLTVLSVGERATELIVEEYQSARASL
ncbi:Glucose-methanol-choline oxidoreductase [Lasiodiplodia theobromae]|uniref:Glucose-methanol-choline oxidoreductase n=1 Tax=Lasiodiplodia theobromae TaxID=45133 RepID=UPI0015C31F97|nr:Glucose-methanol-choline oxidoreductase [Lasiodiplodia theobromae]KAF4540716.1 Glucose-methanol-choline oxidoreductase [Lasiodiplodia theobromae]